MAGLPIPTKYVMPCKNDGKCGIMKWNEYTGKNHSAYALYGPRVLTMPNWTGEVLTGTSFIEFEPGDYNSRVNFACCIGCKLPYNRAESARLNDLIGLELPSAESFKERLARLKSKVATPNAN